MMRTILTITLCFCVFSLGAQGVFNKQSPVQTGGVPTQFTEDLRNVDFFKRNVISQSTLNTIDEDEEGIIGTAYLEKDFKDGRVFYNDTDIGEYPMRYNVYGEEFEILNADETVSAVSKTSEVSIKMGFKKYIFKYYMEDDGRRKFGYFEVLSNMDNATCVLLKKNKKIFSQPRKALNSFEVNRPARFVDMNGYYLLFENEIVKIRPQNGYLTRFFKKRGVNVKSFLAENQIDVKTEEDLKKLINYYNSAL